MMSSPRIWWKSLAVCLVICAIFNACVDANEENASSRTYYDMLQVEFSASIADIKKSYRKLALVYHPDKLSSMNYNETVLEQMKQEFLDIQVAYETLSDEESRKKYDLLLSGIQYDTLTEDSYDDIRYQMYPFEYIAKKGRVRIRFKATMDYHSVPDINVLLRVSLASTLTGFTKKHKFYRRVACPDCGGTGGASGECTICAHCHGMGVAGHYFGNAACGFDAYTKTSCSACKGRGCIPVSKCSRCNGLGRIMAESTLNIELPIGFQSDEEWRVKEIGHLDYNNVIRDVVVKAIVDLPNGWIIHEQELIHNFDIPLEKIFESDSNKFYSLQVPTGDTIELSLPQNISMYSLLHEFNLTYYGIGHFIKEMDDLYRGNVVVSVHTKWSHLNSTNIVHMLETSERFSDDRTINSLKAILSMETVETENYEVSVDDIKIS